MPRFSLTFPDFTTSTASKTLFTINADGTGEWAEVQELHLFGSGSTAAADTQHRGTLERLDATGAGTSTSRTPEQLDMTSRASTMTGAVNYSAEPTTYLTNPVLTMGFNQRGRAQWAVLKGMGCFVYNATGGVKRGVRLISSAAGKVDGTMVWEES